MIDVAGLAFAALAILFGGLLKGAVGMGAPLVAVPVLASIYGVRTAIAVMTVPLIFSNLWQMWTFRRATEGRSALLRLLAGCVVGVVLGTLLLGVLPEAWLSVGLAAILFAYVALSLVRPEVALSSPRARQTAVPAGLLAGVLQGAAGLSTPVIVTFIHSQRLARDAHVFAVSSMFMMLSATQIVALSAVGLMSWHLVALGVAALLPIMFGVWVGQYLSGRVSRQTFERLTLVVLLAIAIGLLTKAVPEILA